MELSALIESMKTAATRVQAKGAEIDRHLGQRRSRDVARMDSWVVSVRSGDLLRVLNELERRMK
jgi:hypothetical protein